MAVLAFSNYKDMMLAPQNKIGPGLSYQCIKKLKVHFPAFRLRHRSEPQSWPDHYQDGLWTDHVHEFVSDPRFEKAYQRGLKGMGSEAQAQGPWRVHVATWAAEQAMRLGGDFVECGVFLGFTSSIVMTFLNWNELAGKRKFFLVDNFEGIVPTLLSEEEKSLGRQGQYGTNIPAPTR